MWTDKQRETIQKFEETAEKAGGYVSWPPSNKAEHDYRAMIQYCRKKGVDCMDLTDDELIMFELAHA